ncbi:hypothetical protein QOZ80_1BG0072930 [Eleusine coracana subsp. coracana]|nr:hypothetical protein QOZ80_1BG0072930 [Eleusine coracana subsp. coracana]
MKHPIEEFLRIVLTCLPAPPFFCTVGRRPSSSGGGGGADRISCLPDAVLSNIVSRLPAKDAARTAALSRRWRRVWASTPLVLDDTHLIDLPAGVGAGPAAVPVDWIAVTNAVSRILIRHPGPFRFVCLTCCYMSLVERPGRLARWLRRFATAGVEDLVLVNRPWPMNLHLPVDVLQIASLRTLYLGFWNFPDTADLPSGPAVFPHLREIGLCHVQINTVDIDHLLACSPVLEKFAFVLNCFNQFHIRIRIPSRSLQCVVFWMSLTKELDVVVAPNLERLILWQWISCSPGSYLHMKVRIGYATKLKVLGYLEPSINQLMIGSTIIESGTKMSPSTMVPSVSILALKVRFGVRKEAKMLPTFLRCFPNTETLHIMSQEADEPTGKLNFKFWQEIQPPRMRWLPS